MCPRRVSMFRSSPVLGVLLVAFVVASAGGSQQEPPFRAGVEVVNVTATVTDDLGRFVPSLTQDDFTVFEDGRPQEIVYFARERVPVSLGILLDVSGSMTPDKMASARDAINRFVFNLLGPEDELFFMAFASRAELMQPWTTDKRAIIQAVRSVTASGGTALYDAVDEALPLAQQGHHRKKALLVISDGNDTNSEVSLSRLREHVRESEVLVYALGVDGAETTDTFPGPTSAPPRGGPRGPSSPFPIPFPGGRGGGRFPLTLPQIIGGGGRFPGTGGDPRRFPVPPPTIARRPFPNATGNRVNADALREITDDTGGRTEIVRGFGDLDSATARIADELSRQYALSYASTGKRDGKWHAIRVSVKNKDFSVRARRGYVAS